MKKTRLFPGDLILLAVAAVLLLAVLALQVTGQSARAEVTSLENELTSVRRQISAAGGPADLPQIRRLLQEEQQRAVPFPSDQEAAATVNRLWAWAAEAGVTLERATYTLGGDAVDGWRYPAHTFSLAGTGKPARVARFIEAMERSGMKTLSPGNLSLSEPDSSNNWRFALVVRIWSAGSPVPQAR